jgi:hypothetical protein
MSASSPHRSGGITRRGFLCGAGAGLAVGVPVAWLGLRGQELLSRTASASAKPSTRDGMPGPFPGRVIEVHHKGAVREDCLVCPDSVQQMVRRGMRELVGGDDDRDAWRCLFQAGDVVGIKVNPVGRRYSPRQQAAISSHALVIEVVAGLKSAGVRTEDIVLFERYADQFRDAGYEALLHTRPMDGVRWYAASAQYSNWQVDIEGYDLRRDRDRHVVGYDSDVFVQMAYAHPDNDPKDDRRYRSHLSVVVSRMVNKVINLPVLKDHGSGGVTLALKNLSHGLNNNVARSHLTGFRHADATSGPNQCNTFIPAAVNQPAIRQKTVLHILDGLIAVYEGGPAARFTWPYRSLFFATDPVALDHVGWNIIDAKRVAVGLQPVAQTGLQFDTLGHPAGSGAAAHARRGKETLDRRQPEHIILAETVGLGVFDAGRIDHRRIALS